MATPSGFSQNDLRWAWKPVGVHGDHMGNWPLFKASHPIGCITTAIAWVMWRFKYRTHPGMFNDWLRRSGGYTADGLILHDTVARYTGGAYRWIETNAANTDMRVIIAVKWGTLIHWVAHVDGSGATERCMDPWDGKIKLLNQAKWKPTGRRVRLVA